MSSKGKEERAKRISGDFCAPMLGLGDMQGNEVQQRAKTTFKWFSGRLGVSFNGMNFLISTVSCGSLNVML